MELFFAKIMCYLCAFIMSINSSCFTLIHTQEVPQIDENSDVRIVSFNIRCNSDSPFIKSIFHRSLLICGQLKEINADSIGFQEVTPEWMPYLEKLLPEYNYVCLFRSDEEKEAAPVFYRKDKYNLSDSGTFWLSDTPDVYGSKYEESDCVRICTWVLLENKETGEKFYHLNTHLDHISNEARFKQLEVLYAKAKEFEKKYPVIITGDFNDHEKSELYKNMTKDFNDCRTSATVTDNTRTYHDYGNVSSIIDFILTSKNAKAHVFDTIAEKINGCYLSDHNGIWADIEF